MCFLEYLTSIWKLPSTSEHSFTLCFESLYLLVLLLNEPIEGARSRFHLLQNESFAAIVTHYAKDNIFDSCTDGVCLPGLVDTLVKQDDTSRGLGRVGLLEDARDTFLVFLRS